MIRAMDSFYKVMSHNEGMFKDDKAYRVAKNCLEHFEVGSSPHYELIHYLAISGVIDYYYDDNNGSGYWYIANESIIADKIGNIIFTNPTDKTKERFNITGDLKPQYRLQSSELQNEITFSSNNVGLELLKSIPIMSIDKVANKNEPNTGTMYNRRTKKTINLCDTECHNIYTSDDKVYANRYYKDINGKWWGLSLKKPDAMTWAYLLMDEIKVFENTISFKYLPIVLGRALSIYNHYTYEDLVKKKLSFELTDKSLKELRRILRGAKWM